MRVGDSVWHSSRIDEENAEISEYEEPTEIRTRFAYFTVMPATSRGYMAVMQYGEDIERTWTAIAIDRAFHGKIKEGDLMWVDGEKPIDKVEEDYGIGASANAIVKSVAEVDHSITITLERNQNRTIK
jgi:hypothetical protein